MIYHKGRWLIAPEIKALLSKLEDLNKELRSGADRVLRENAELRAKVESANRQIAEYDDELRKAKKLLKVAVEDMTGMQFGEECKVCSKKLLPNECPIHNNAACILEKDFKWRYAAEALALIGEDGDQNENS